MPLGQPQASAQQPPIGRLCPQNCSPESHLKIRICSFAAPPIFSLSFVNLPQATAQPKRPSAFHGVAAA
jgi:hypothetical protein